MIFWNKKKKTDSSTGIYETHDTERGEDFAAQVAPEFDVAGMTDIGKHRQVNQDQFLIAELHKSLRLTSSSETMTQEELSGKSFGQLMLVADGMGGANAGEVASGIAVQSMAEYLLNSMHWIFEPTRDDIQRFLTDLKSGAIYTHQTVREKALQVPEFDGMGTTLTVAYVHWPMLYVVHVGDSRCYVQRDGALQLLTHDQTLAQTLNDQGYLSAESVGNSPYQHVLISVIGGSEGPDVMVYKTRLLKRDRVLLCTDGVNGHLSDSQIGEILSEQSNAKELCERLIQASNDEGGKDNITAIVALT